MSEAPARKSNNNQNRRGQNGNREGNNGGRRNPASRGSGEGGNVDMRKYDKMISAAHNNFSDIACGNKTDDCVICCKPNDVFAIGACRHPVCAECAIRIRILGQSKICPVCRAEVEISFFCTTNDDLMNVPLFFAKTKHPDEDRYGIRFSNSIAGSKYEKYLAHICKICKGEDGDRLEFPTFMSLRQHMANNHQLSYCHICTDNLSLFSRERKTYTREQLQRHIRIGDNDDKSFKGHPQCLFCELKFLDEENRYKHLRKDHFFCQFCEADGTMTNVFFGKHDELKNHYKQHHYICENEECREMGIAFANKLGLDLHRARDHDEKRIDLGFGIAPRDVGAGRGRRAQLPPEPVPRERIAVVQRQQLNNPQSDPSQFTVVPSAQSRGPTRYTSTRPNFTPQAQDFPSLAPAPPPPVLRSNDFPRLNKVNKSERKEEEPVEDFPTLGGAGSSTRVSVKPLPKAKKVVQQSKKPVTNTKPMNSKVERERSFSPPREYVPQTTVKVKNTLLRFDTVSNSSAAPAAKSNIQLIQRAKTENGPSSSSASSRLPTSSNFDFPSLPPASAPSSQPGNSAWLNSKSKKKGVISSVHVPANYSAVTKNQNTKKNKKSKVPVNDVWSSLGPAPEEVKPLVDTESWQSVPLSKEAQAEKDKQAKREEWARKKAEIRAAVAKSSKTAPESVPTPKVESLPAPVFVEAKEEEFKEVKSKAASSSSSKVKTRQEEKKETIQKNENVQEADVSEPSSIQESSAIFNESVDALWTMPSLTSLLSNFSLSMFGTGSQPSTPDGPPPPPPGLENVVLAPPPGLSANTNQISFSSAPILSYDDVKQKAEPEPVVNKRQADDDGWITTGPVKNNAKNKKKNKK